MGTKGPRTEILRSLSPESRSRKRRWGFWWRNFRISNSDVRTAGQAKFVDGGENSRIETTSKLSTSRHDILPKEYIGRSPGRTFITRRKQKRILILSKITRIETSLRRELLLLISYTFILANSKYWRNRNRQPCGLRLPAWVSQCSTVAPSAKLRSDRRHTRRAYVSNANIFGWNLLALF